MVIRLNTIRVIWLGHIWDIKIKIYEVLGINLSISYIYNQ